MLIYEYEVSGENVDEDDSYDEDFEDGFFDFYPPIDI
jgi:hypothetical protein